MRLLSSSVHQRVLLCAWLAAAGAWGDNLLLFDFEGDVQGWENEAQVPDPAGLAMDKARHGSSSLAFTHQFTPSFPTLQCRVKEGFPRDVSNLVGFQGFSAWVYIPNERGVWEARMFVRSSDEWKWAEGKPAKSLQAGWHRVEILAKDIFDRESIQDLGVQIMHFGGETEDMICIDQVEIMLREDDPVEPGR